MSATDIGIDLGTANVIITLGKRGLKSIGKKILNIFISVVSLGVIYFIHF